MKEVLFICLQNIFLLFSLIACPSVRCVWSWAHMMMGLGYARKALTKLPRSTPDLLVVEGQHLLSYPPYFLSRYLERLLRSLVYLP